MISDSETESDSERRPDDDMAKFLSLQSRIYHIQPECAQVGHRISRKHKAVQMTTEVARLLERVHKIESDILFDRDEGLSKWAEMRNQLANDDAERRRFHLDKPPNLKEEAIIPQALEKRDLADTSEHADPMDSLEDFFSSLPETSTNADTGATQIISTRVEGENIIIRDFGKWTGQNPRRIFEETCQARFAVSSLRHSNC